MELISNFMWEECPGGGSMYKDKDWDNGGSSLTNHEICDLWSRIQDRKLSKDCLFSV